MNFIKSTILLFLLFVSYSLSAETLLNKSSVSKFIQNVNNAASSRNADILTSYYTDDISITLDQPKSIGGTKRLNKEQFKKFTKDSAAKYKNYTYDVKDIVIKISQDHKSATVTSLLYETVEIDGMTLSIKSNERMSLINSNGALKINSYYSKVLPKNIKISPIASQADKNNSSAKAAAGLSENSPIIKIFKIGIVHGNFKIVADGFNRIVKEEEKKLQKANALNAVRHGANIGFFKVMANIAKDVMNKKIPEAIGKELLVSGMAYQSAREDTGIKISKHTLKKIRNYPNAHFLLGKLYFKKCISKGKYCKEGFLQHQLALANDPNFIYSYLDMGGIYMHKQRFKEAIATYKQAISIPSSNGIQGLSHTALTLIYAKMKLWSKSNIHMNKAVTLGVKFPKEILVALKKDSAGNNNSVKTNNGSIKAEAFDAGHNGNFKVAQKLLNSLIEIEEKKFEAEHILRGLSNTSLIAHYRALEQVSIDAIDKKISSGAAKLLFEATKLAGIRLSDGINLTGNTILSENLESYPNAHFLLGRLYFLDCTQNKRNCDRSISEHQAALTHDPKLIYSYFDIGYIYKKMKKSEEAIKVYEKASLVPSGDRLKGVIHFELTKLYGQLLKGDKAKTHLQRSVALGIVVPKEITKMVNMTAELTKQKSKDNIIDGWTHVTGGKESNTSFYFNSNALRKEENKVLMPVLVNYKSAKLGSTGKHYKSMKSEFEHDCSKKQYRVVNITTYSGREGKGKVLKKSASTGKWFPVKAGKVAERLWSHACNQKEKIAGI